jgi:hypothetical protein
MPHRRQCCKIPDFVPINRLAVFRSHYEQSGVSPKNGNTRGTSPEAGGDMGGAVFTKQADLDTGGTVLVNYKQ